MIYKKCLQIFLSIILLLISATGFTGRASADNFSTSFECSGSVISFSAEAPGSVTQGSAVNITNISSSSSVPGGFTVNKIVSTDTASNATPSTSTSTWTGTGTGTFTVNYPNQGLTATGPAGSEINVVLSSIVIYISGISTPITCDVSNGLLTTSGAGESLTLETIDINAPPETTTTTSNTPTATTANTGSTPSKNTSSSNPTISSAPPVTVSTPTSTPQALSTSASTNKPVETGGVSIIVQDKVGHAIKGAKVTIDSLPTELTNTSGTVLFNKVVYGGHKVTVSYNGTSSRNTFQLGTSYYTKEISMPINTKLALTSDRIALVSSGSLLLVILFVFTILRFRGHHTRQMTAEPLANTGLSEAMPVGQQFIVSPSNEVAAENTPEPPLIKPQLNQQTNSPITQEVATSTALSSKDLPAPSLEQAQPNIISPLSTTPNIPKSVVEQSLPNITDPPSIANPDNDIHKVS